jgi:tRNA1(Val) A37 N6-methylase TrmN6
MALKASKNSLAAESVEQSDDQSYLASSSINRSQLVIQMDQIKYDVKTLKKRAKSVDLPKKKVL